MSSKLIIITLAVVILGLGGYLLFGGSTSSIVEPLRPFVPALQAPAVFDPLNATYTIDEQPITLVEGKYKGEAVPGSGVEDTVQIFGVPVVGDFDDDGDSDAVMMLVENPGGTGTFYYITSAVNENGKTKGTNAIFIGDRISPKNIEIQGRKIIVNYADRKPDEPMAVAPSVSITKEFVVAQGILREAAQ